MKRLFRRTKRVVVPPPANGANGRTTTGEYDAIASECDQRSEAALERIRAATETAVSAVRARRAGHAAVKP